MQHNVNFIAGNPLATSQVYYSAIGVLTDNQFTLRSVIQNGDTGQEAARVYQKSPYDNTQLYILYYPGKDNDFPISIEKTTTPLRSIVETADEQLAKEFNESELAKAKKLFIIAESNTYLGFEVTHYIKGECTGLHNGKSTLITEDSIDRDYDESYITNLIPHTTRTAIKRGTQNMIFDHWSCGHHVIQAIKRMITGQNIPSNFAITETILKENSAYYKKGTFASRIGKKFIFENRDFHELDIPVSGKIGYHANGNTLSMSLAKLELALQEDDRDLEIINASTKDEMIIKIFTNKDLPYFKYLGLERTRDENTPAYYECHISKDQPMHASEPLFGINVRCGNKTASIDITDMFSTEKIHTFSQQINPQRAERNIQPNATLTAIKATNQYLVKRAGETSYWGTMVNLFSGQDYYSRRTSWTKILGKINQYHNQKISLKELRKTVRTEMSNFNPGIFSCVQRNKYYTCLKDLYDTLNEENLENQEVKNRVAGYCQIYTEMEKHKRATHSYVQQYSIFSENKGEPAPLIRKRTTYESYHRLLDESDKADFLSTDELKNAEFKNYDCF